MPTRRDQKQALHCTSMGYLGAAAPKRPFGYFWAAPKVPRVRRREISPGRGLPKSKSVEGTVPSAGAAPKAPRARRREPSPPFRRGPIRKCSRPAVMGREHRNLYTSWCHPPSPPPRNAPPGRSLSGPMVRGAGRGVSARAHGLSSPGPPAPLAAQGRCSLFGGWAGYSCPVIAPSILYCMCFWGKCQGPYFSRRFLLLTMFRQSMSPRSMPSTSISAVATLEAKGMLFWSHRRVI